MRLALLGPTHPYKGGIAQHTTELAHRLTGAGVDVEIWSWRRQFPARLYPGEQRVPGAAELPDFPRTSEPLSWDRPLGWLAAGRRARRERLDGLLLSWTTPLQGPAYAGVLSGYAGTGRVVALCHNVLPHEPSRVDRPLARLVLGRCDGLLVHSQEQSVAAHAIAPRARVGVAPLPPPPITAGGTEAAAPPRRSLLFFGLVRPYKGLDVLLRALARPEVPADVRLVVAGEFWSPVEETRALVRDLGLGGRVELRPGYVAADEVPGLLAGADAVVLPYRSATASIVPDLAHRHGVPVVATRVGTLPDTVRDGVDGVLVAPEDPAALAAALGGLYAGGALARLRAGIDPPDRDGVWATYVGAVLGLVRAAPPAAASRGAGR